MDEDEETFGNSHWKLSLRKIKKISLYNSKYNLGNNKNSITFPSVSSGFLKGYPYEYVNLQVGNIDEMNSCIKIYSYFRQYYPRKILSFGELRKEILSILIPCL